MWYLCLRSAADHTMTCSVWKCVLTSAFLCVILFPYCANFCEGDSEPEVGLRRKLWETQELMSSPIRSPQDGGLDASRVFTGKRRVLQAQGSNNVSCPLEFRQMRDFPWFAQTCQIQGIPDANSSCCTALLYALGQSESDYLRTDGQFRLKDEATVAACMDDLTLELQTEGLNNDIVPTCFPEGNYSTFVSKPSNCQGIETRTDFEQRIGPGRNASLDATCSGSLSDLEVCSACVVTISDVITSLSIGSSNNTDCSVYTLLYAAGISNRYGPFNPGTAQCILSVTLTGGDSSSSRPLALDIGVGAIAAFVVSLIACLLFYLWWRRSKNAIHRDFIERNNRLLRPNTGLVEYSFDEIKVATKNFSPKNYIGSGGFGDVYKGRLDDGLEVAVKRMKNCSPDGDAEFVNEVNVINSIRHRNLVMLRGCCVASTDSDGHQRLLVYDYMPNGSLHDYLFGKDRRPLPWPARRKLAIGMAKGIDYLHNNTRPPIIHRDIKPSNILLDENLNGKVADFGLAKLTIEGQSHVTTAVAGTLGYMAPEYALYGKLTDKTDVYSFGVVLLELMSGKPALDGNAEGSSSSSSTGYSLITDWAWERAKEGNLLEIVDETIRTQGSRDVMERFVLIGILCSHMQVAFRPSMADVLKYFHGDLPLPQIPNRPLPFNREV